MNRERMVWIGLAAVLVLGLVFGAVSSGQRDAWLEGYTMGRLAASSGDGAAVVTAPYLPYAYGGGPQHGFGFGGFLFLLFAGGLIFFLVTRFARMAQWRAWAAQGGPGGPGGPGGQGWQGPPPWAQHRMRWGCQGEQAEAAPPAAPPAVQPPAVPPDPNAAPPVAG